MGSELFSDDLELDGMPAPDPVAVWNAKQRRITSTLVDLHTMAQLQAARSRSIARTVDALRILNVSWSAIGDALDTSRQAAQQRYGQTS